MVKIYEFKIKYWPIEKKWICAEKIWNLVPYSQPERLWFSRFRIKSERGYCNTFPSYIQKNQQQKC